MTSHIFKEMDLTITCVNMVEMTKKKQFQNNLFGKVLCSFFVLEAAYSWKIRLVQNPPNCVVAIKREGRNLALFLLKALFIFP